MIDDSIRPEVVEALAVAMGRDQLTEPAAAGGNPFAATVKTSAERARDVASVAASFSPTPTEAELAAARQAAQSGVAQDLDRLARGEVDDGE